MSLYIPRNRLIFRSLTTSLLLLFCLILTTRSLFVYSTLDDDMKAAAVVTRKNLTSATTEDPKYFLEPGQGEILGHYDLRFYRGSPVSDEERASSQRRMIRAYLLYFHSLNIQTWLAHGTLLGWWWNRKFLPWDGDIDMQVWDTALYSLAENYNMTTYTYVETETNEGGISVEVESRYLLDVNPNYAIRDRGNWMNIIDARWIDVSNGLFIDITGLSETEPGTWSCKNYHRYRKDDLIPLQETTFENVQAFIPNAFKDILVEEYQVGALTVTEFGSYSWDARKKEWVGRDDASATGMRGGRGNDFHLV